MAKKKKVISKPKTKKIRFNEIGTGRLIWIDSTEYNKFISKYAKDKKEYTVKKQIKQNEIKRKSFEKTSYENLKNNKALNFQGKKKKEKILKLAKKLDKRKIDYSLQDILKQDLSKKTIVEFNKIPEQYFYWNLQNKINANEFGENVKYSIKDFEGKLIYEGFNEGKALGLIDTFNKRIKAAEKEFGTKKGLTIYPTVPVNEGEFIDDFNQLRTDELRIDYSQIKTNLPDDYNDEFLKSLYE